jgi:hypothetical protein
MLLASSVSGLFKWRQFEPEVILTRDFLFGLLIAVVSRLVAGRSLAAFSVYCLLAREPKKSVNQNDFFRSDGRLGKLLSALYESPALEFSGSGLPSVDTDCR